MSNWRMMRESIKSKIVEHQCVVVDQWWQQCPLVNYHLSWTDIENWPDPWTLLSENIYCPLSRALGMIYTLLLNEVNNVELVLVRDEQAEEHYLVLVDKPKYTLNYWPNSVISSNLSNFQVISSKSLESIKAKIK